MFRASVGGGAASSTQYRHPLIEAMIGLLRPLAASTPARRGGWSDMPLALCTLLMSWGEQATLADRFLAAHELAGPPRGLTYSGFIKALRRSGALIHTLRTHLMLQLQAGTDDLWTIHGWCVFVIDGSKFDAPRTSVNELGLGAAGRDGAGPQMLATILVHLGTCVLWNWRIGRARGSERGHLRRLFRSTPKNALLIADAGFVGFECLREVVKSGRHVLVRLAGNADVISHLDERPDIVALWPKKMQSRSEPLLLRLIRVPDGRGGHLMLGTSVLERERLSDEHAAALYRLRWGVEVCYRSLKQTMERRKMRSAAPVQARLELHWTMMGFMFLGLLTLSRVGRRARGRWSVANALRAIRHAARARTSPRALHWLQTLSRAVIGDNTRARKQARNWPHKKRQHPPGPPVIRRATPAEHDRYAKILANLP